MSADFHRWIFHGVSIVHSFHLFSTFCYETWGCRKISLGIGSVLQGISAPFLGRNVVLDSEPHI